jgi:mevalonate kinase
MANPTKAGKGRARIKRGPGKRMVDGKSFRLADEVRYIQQRAAAHDSRIVSIGQLVLFSSESGDAWMLDPSEHLAVHLASDGRPEPIHIEDTETTFTVAWTGQYGIVGPAFLYTDRESRRVTTMFGYPTRKLAQMGATGAGRGGNAVQLLKRARAKISNIFG